LPEVLAAAIIKAMSILIYQTTWRYNPEDSHLQKVIFFVFVVEGLD
jgi:hypothetical protein